MSNSFVPRVERMGENGRGKEKEINISDAHRFALFVALPYLIFESELSFDIASHRVAISVQQHRSVQFFAAFLPSSIAVSLSLRVCGCLGVRQKFIDSPSPVLILRVSYLLLSFEFYCFRGRERQKSDFVFVITIFGYR